MSNAAAASLIDQSVATALRINAKKADLDVKQLSLVWVPSRVTANGDVELIGTLES